MVTKDDRNCHIGACCATDPVKTVRHAAEQGVSSLQLDMGCDAAGLLRGPRCGIYIVKSGG